MRAGLSGIVDRMGAALFPHVCPGCGGETGEARTLCAPCWREAHFVAGPVCDGCGRPAPGLPRFEAEFRCDECLGHPGAWDRARGVMLYRGTARRLVLALKHGDRLDLVPMIGGWAARAGRELIEAADIAAPVPLHWTRRVRRRFNQSAEIARRALAEAGRSDILAPTLLTRTRRTASQDGRNRAERAENLAGAIALAPGAAARVAGRRVLLFDDVMTTGATLSAAARALKAAGATGVDAVVIALVEPHENAYLGANAAIEEPEA